MAPPAQAGVGLTNRQQTLRQLVMQSDNDLVEAFDHGNDLSPELVERLVRETGQLLDSDPQGALKSSRTAVAVAERLDHRFSKGQAHRAFAAALTRSDEHAQAVEHFNRSLELFELEGNSLEVAKTLMNRINALLKLSRFEEALSDAAVVTTAFEESGEDLRLAKHLNNLGHIYFRLDRFEENLECLAKAESILAGVNDPQTLCYVYLNRAVALTSLNRSDEALRFYAQAKALATENDMPRTAAQCEYNRCFLHFMQGQYTTALNLLSRVRTEMYELGDRWHTALCDMDQAEIYIELNMYHEAQELARLAREAFRTLEMDYEMARCTVLLGLASFHLKGESGALELFGQARQMFERQGNEVWLSTLEVYEGAVHLRLGEASKARELFLKAFAFFAESGLKTKAVHARMLAGRANMGLGLLDEAWADVTDAKRIWEDSPVPWLRYQLQHLIGDICRGRNNSAGAKVAYSESIESLETLRTRIHADGLRISFLKDKMAIYESLLELLVSTTETEDSLKAFEIVGQAKSRTLVDMLATGMDVVDRHDRAADEATAHLQRLREELNWFYSRMKTVEEKAAAKSHGVIRELIDEVRNRESELLRLSHKSPRRLRDYANLQFVTTSSLEDIQEVIGEDEVLVEYYIVGDRIIAFAVSRDGFRLHDNLSSRPAVRKAFDLLRFHLMKCSMAGAGGNKKRLVDLEPVTAHLRELYDALVRPIEETIFGRRSVVFAPHDFLHYVPFHALHDRDLYLIDRHRVSYAPSSSILCLCKQRRESRDGRPLLMGVPDGETPFIREEIEELRSTLTDAHVFVGADAGVDKLREFGAQANLIHIVSHGAFRQDNPMFSSIELGDTRLSLFDIYNLRTSADLVTLSGCGTGRSSIAAGDELIGLVRGFFYAGASSVVVSLWDVNDRSTAEIMAGFYRNLAVGETKAESLRKAMIGVREKYEHPYFWAPFILTGANA